MINFVATLLLSQSKDFGFHSKWDGTLLQASYKEWRFLFNIFKKQKNKKPQKQKQKNLLVEKSP